ncbi:MAG: hypothetical protein K9L30_18580 [Desulfobacterales bacterium]|nr:hypothetical protein [Desulfobacterales bacterium]
MSTTLQNAFRMHPKIFLGYKTIFFSPELDFYERGLSYYESFFINAKEGQVVIESDEHLIVPAVDKEWWVNLPGLPEIDTVIERIRLTLGKPKVMIVFRKQPEMFLSKYVEYVNGGGSARNYEFFEWICSNETALQGFCYDKIIKKLANEFGEENLFIFPLEAFRSQESRLLERLANFIGVERMELPAKGKRNVSPSSKAVELQRFINHCLVRRKNTLLEKQSMRFIPRWMWIIQKKAVKKADRILVAKKQRDSIMPELYRDKIEKYFKTSNEETSNLLQIDLAELGYY